MIAEGLEALRYRCLVIDHDDTAVMSTPLVHYPAHVEAMRRLRPGTVPVRLDGWMLKNFDPGLLGYLVGELGLNDEELAENYRIWREFTGAAIPSFFPGILGILQEFKSRGGYLVVASHSEVPMIERDYRAAAAGVAPDLVFGWDQDPRKRKPSAYPVTEAMRRLRLARSEVLVLDDLKPGADMAEAAGVAFAAAGWGHAIPEIKSAMLAKSAFYLSTTGELAFLLFP